MELSVFNEIRTIAVNPAGVRRTHDETIEQVILADELGYLPSLRVIAEGGAYRGQIFHNYASKR